MSDILREYYKICEIFVVVEYFGKLKLKIMIMSRKRFWLKENW